MSETAHLDVLIPANTGHDTGLCLPFDSLSNSLFREALHTQAPSVTRGFHVLQNLQFFQPQLESFAENGDYATLEHSIRVALIARLGATVLELGSFSQNLAEMSGLAHDLGKLDPDISEIVNSGRVLTCLERKKVNEHAYLGFVRQYEAGRDTEASLHDRLGGFMSRVALDTLFSHALAINRSQQGLNDTKIVELVESKIITEQDATYYVRARSVQLLAVADVIDALLSNGTERAYRLSRLESEGRAVEIDPSQLPALIQDIIDVPSIDVDTVVASAVRHYEAITSAAKLIVLRLANRTFRHAAPAVIDLTDTTSSRRQYHQA